MRAALDQVEPAIHVAIVERVQVSSHHQDQVTVG
jgi:hypothetical protein